MTSNITGKIGSCLKSSELDKRYIKYKPDVLATSLGFRAGVNALDAYVGLNMPETGMKPRADFSLESFMHPQQPTPSEIACGHGFILGLAQAGFGVIKLSMNVNEEFRTSMKMSGIGDIVTGAGLIAQASCGSSAFPVVIAGIAITSAAKVVEIANCKLQWNSNRC